MRINIAAIGLLALTSLGHAATIAVTNDGSGAASGHQNNDLAGWSFTTADAITVSQIGIFVSRASLADSHDLGIYTETGTELGSATIGATATPDGQGYAYTPITLTLDAGTYFIGAYYNSGSLDQMRVGNGGSASSVVMASGLTFNGAELYFFGAAFDPANPVGAGANHFTSATSAAYFGPNFQFDLATPEPGTFWLLGLSSVCLLIARRRLARS
jgi:hypothetical protein